MRYTALLTRCPAEKRGGGVPDFDFDFDFVWRL
jgi:hypothetical protein